MRAIPWVIPCLSFLAACGGNGPHVDPPPDGGPKRVVIDPAEASAASGNLSAVAPGLASTSSLHALAARAAALALSAGTPATPVTLSASLRTESEPRSPALQAGSALAFGFQIVLSNAPQAVPTLSGVVVLTQTTGGVDVVLGVGSSPGSAIPPGLGILQEAESKVWAATAGQEGAQLAATTIACSGPSISGVTCQEATFSSGGLAITSSDPIAGGATGSRSASLTTQPLVGVSLTVDCDLTTLCPAPSPPGPPSVFFAADDGVHGLELWGTDGTPGGTVMVKDIHPTASSTPTGFAKLGADTYFTANDGTHGAELWKTDGTSTEMVMDINPGTASSSPGELTVVGSELFFTAQTAANGRQIWKTDGGTTQMVSNLPTLVSANTLHVFNAALYFKGRTFAAGIELWKADSSGVAQVKDLNPDAGHGLNCQGGFTDYDNALYFAADNGMTGCELFKMDGTTNAISLVQEFNPGTTGTNVFNLTVVGSTLFFSADTPSSGLELWKTDGTTTQMVKDIVPDAGSSGLAYFATVTTPSGAELLVFSCVYPSGSMLCVSDGTAAGTTFLGRLGAPTSTKWLTTAADKKKVYFQAQGGLTPDGGTSAGAELWVTDGTSAGTVQLKDINPGLSGSEPTLFMPVGPNNHTVVFEAMTAATGNELWVTDGTPGGTTLLKDILPGPGDGLPQPFLR
jgi:ELWxxDGT repeat protein